MEVHIKMSTKMKAILSMLKCINSSTPAQKGRPFTDDIFRYIFVNEKFYVLIKISMKVVF